MSAPSDLKLELVQVLFRHGARTCSASEATLAIPGYIDQSFHQIHGYEQLTSVGKAQAQALGERLRERYDDLLPAKYRGEHVYAYSSDCDRTKASLALLLAGLYPALDDFQIWSSAAPSWQPVPYHSLPRELDTLLQGYRRPRYRQLMKEMLASEQGREREAKASNLNRFLQKKRVHSVKSLGLYGCYGVYNVLSAHATSNAIIPDWYTDELMEVLKRHVLDYLDVVHLTSEMRKLAIGPLIKRFIENMDVEDKLKNPRKIYLYSGHDLNVYPFLRAHGVDEFKLPGFSSAVILEKFRDPDDEIYVRLLMSAGAGDPFVTLKLANREFCPIKEYLSVVGDVVPTDEELDVILEDTHAAVDFKKVYTTDFAHRPDYEP